MIKLDNEPDFQLTGTDHGPETLLLALGAVLNAAGRPMHYHDLAGATGLAFLFAWAPDDAGCLARRGQAGREVVLTRANDALNLVMRPFHPRGLDGGASCGRFEKHFVDSYAPLMAGAIGHGQPLLAWGGWPEDDKGAARVHSWGVLTRCDPAAGRFGGWSAESLDGPAWLAAPPRVVDAVEAVLEPVPPSRMLPGGLRLAAGWRRDPLLVAQGVAVGTEAMRQWAAAVGGSEPICPACGDDGWRCQHALLEGLYAARVSAYEFIYRNAESAASAAMRELCQRLEGSLGAQVELLAEIKDASAVRASMANGSSRIAVAGEIARLAELESQIEQDLDSALGA
ncbi:MAG: hypothetical protein BIFFINMI_01683 [Phycisphaerae bacterium]|nr:hypothetical protein [Phycisphaerae bacterium]